MALVLLFIGLFFAWLAYEAWKYLSKYPEGHPLREGAGALTATVLSLVVLAVLEALFGVINWVDGGLDGFMRFLFYSWCALVLFSWCRAVWRTVEYYRSGEAWLFSERRRRQAPPQRISARDAEDDLPEARAKAAQQRAFAGQGGSIARAAQATAQPASGQGYELDMDR